MSELIDHITSSVYDAIDSDETSRDAIVAEVEALSSYDVCAPGQDGHEDCDDDDECVTMDDWPSLADVGDVVATWLRDQADERIGHDIVRLIFLEVLDLDRVVIAEEFGRLYYPDHALTMLRQAGRLS